MRFELQFHPVLSSSPVRKFLLQRTRELMAGRLPQSIRIPPVPLAEGRCWRAELRQRLIADAEALVLLLESEALRQAELELAEEDALSALRALSATRLATRRSFFGHLEDHQLESDELGEADFTGELRIAYLAYLASAALQTSLIQGLTEISHRSFS